MMALLLDLDYLLAGEGGGGGLELVMNDVPLVGMLALAHGYPASQAVGG